MAAAGGLNWRTSRELWTILLRRSSMKDGIKAELDRYGDRLLKGLAYYKPPSTSSADKVKANKNLSPALRELGLRLSKFLALDEEQSVELLQTYLQYDYRGTQESLKADVMHLTNPEVRQKLFKDILGGTQALLLVPRSVACLHLDSMLCTVLIILLRRWKNQRDPQLLLNVCETLQEEVVSLVDHTGHEVPVSDSSEDKDSMETEDMGRIRQKDQRDGVCVLGLHLAKELCEVDEEGDQWQQVLRKLPILPMLFSALEVSLRIKQNLHFCEAILHFLFTLAKTHQGAAAMAGAGITQTVCLPLLSVFQLNFNGAGSCLNAVRSVQSLACLEEADHTVGLMLQLSNFTKEWHFHLPQLIKDVQVNLCYLCQACTSLLHSRKMLQHYLQIKNGESASSASTPRGQRTPQTPSKPPTAESEALELRQLRTVQHSLLKILGKTLATLRAFTPDLCQILQVQPLDLAQYNLLFALSFTTPAFDADVTPSFGTLLATVNVTLSMLGEVSAHVHHGEFYLRDPSVHPRDKQRMKQELSSELSTLLSSLSRYFRRGGPSSPAGGLMPSPQPKGASAAKVAPEAQEPLIQLVQAFVRHVQR